MIEIGTNLALVIIALIFGIITFVMFILGERKSPKDLLDKCLKDNEMWKCDCNKCDDKKVK